MNGAHVDTDITVPFIFSAEGVSIGSDYADSVDHENHRTTLPFTGTVERVAYDLAGTANQNAEAETRRGMSQQQGVRTDRHRVHDSVLPGRLGVELVTAGDQRQFLVARVASDSLRGRACRAPCAP